MGPDLWTLYEMMKRSRAYEEAIARLWRQGLISGEMHLGTGEEAIVAGVMDHIRDGDALALDHRGTPPYLMRGLDPLPLLRELLGEEDGLCKGQGGHMHLYAKDHLLASSGIVGASGPAAAGFALAAGHLRPQALAVAFFGEGAMNQGMLMESLNLAAVWELPLLFVCKDDEWAITTDSRQVAMGNLRDRVQGLGVPYQAVDGLDVTAVWKAARRGIERARNGEGPTFLHAKCVHLEAHFLGYQLLRLTRSPLEELPRIALPLLRSFLSIPGAPIRERIQGMRSILTSLVKTIRDPRESSANDPLRRARMPLAVDPERLNALEAALEEEVNRTVAAALKGGS